MNKALFVSLTDDFVVGFKVFIKSLLNYNSWILKYQLIILDLGLTEENKNICKQLYSNCVFKKPKYDNYKKTKTSNLDKPYYKNNYYKIDIFSYEEYDQIVSIDTDMLILGDISELFKDHSLSACKCYLMGKKKLHDYKINDGLVIIGKQYINQKIYKDLLELTYINDYKFAEQDLFSMYFKDKINYLSKIYNFEKRMIHCEKEEDKVNFDDVRVLHYVGKKPWQDIEFDNDYPELEKLWWNIHNE